MMTLVLVAVIVAILVSVVITFAEASLRSLTAKDLKKLAMENAARARIERENQDRKSVV